MGLNTQSAIMIGERQGLRCLYYRILQITYLECRPYPSKYRVSKWYITSGAPVGSVRFCLPLPLLPSTTIRVDRMTSRTTNTRYPPTNVNSPPGTPGTGTSHPGRVHDGVYDVFTDFEEIVSRPLNSVDNSYIFPVATLTDGGQNNG
jgi:hypothetical protein